MRSVFLAVGFAFVVGAAGCDFLLGVEDRRVVGILAKEPSFENGLEVPDTADAGVAFSVGVTTVGPTPCWQPDGEDVTTGDHLVEIVPTIVSREPRMGRAPIRWFSFHGR